MTQETHCVAEIIHGNAGRTSSVAIESEGRHPLTYPNLAEQVDKVVRDLTAAGFKKGDRIALALPNGPEMAVAFLSVVSAFTCAPLNPSSQIDEFDFLLNAMRIKAVIVQPGSTSNAALAAEKEGIRVIKLTPSMGKEAGIFSLSLGSHPGAEPTFSDPGDVALLLHTSGTTSKPKLIPLSQSNICISAGNVLSTLNLGPEDRFLNVLPLFHVHGLGMLLASLKAGARVACTPGFQALSFLDWLDDFQPTWYSAVPAMHQAILSMVARTSYVPSVHLKFIRSASSHLPPSVMAELERVFSCPVIEAYGMTEASHNIASNQLPPLIRKPGSVGIAVGNEVSIMDEAGNLLPCGEKGEIAIRGPNVMNGYENNPSATKSAFINGWFRTGDQGYIDSDGYIFIAGRIKEQINRGGEKVSPREVEEALLSLPSVAQAVAFAVPSTLLGEEVAAAVVLRDGQLPDEQALRLGVADRLATFKVPSRVLFLKELPHGPTGKVQRIGLAEKLGLGVVGQKAEERVRQIPPRTETEKRLAEIWCEVLKCSVVSINEGFLQVGGDSILATLVISRVRTAFGIDVPIIALFEAQTIEKMAIYIDGLLANAKGAKLAER